MIKIAIRGLVTAALAVPLLVAAPIARADDKPAGTTDTAEVLGKLHASNQKEIEMGKLALKNGQSKDVKNFGKMLVKDHTDADKKVAALAKQEKIDLASSTPMTADDMGKIPSGTGFDVAFARSMLDDHQKDVAEVKGARDNTTDKELKSLLDQLLPTLEKHEDTAARLARTQGQGTE